MRPILSAVFCASSAWLLYSSLVYTRVGAALCATGLSAGLDSVTAAAATIAAGCAAAADFKDSSAGFTACVDADCGGWGSAR